MMAKRLGKSRPDDGLLLGPAGCMRVRNTGRACDTCGAPRNLLHVPLRSRGAFCAACCPCCAPRGRQLSRVH
jgi:hypothetical protein